MDRSNVPAWVGRITQCMRDKGLTQNDLAEQSGVSPLAIYDILGEGMSTPNVVVFRSISKVLGVSMEYLMGDEDEVNLLVADGIIVPELRPCLVLGRKHYFHRWYERRWVVEPSPMIGGHPGGCCAMTIAIVEDENGCVHEVSPRDIRFLDRESSDPPCKDLCSCYHDEGDEPCCWGTQEKDPCFCGGDKSKCTFYGGSQS